MTKRTKFLALLGAGTALAFGIVAGPMLAPSIFVPQASAQSVSKQIVDQAKANGIVGEQSDGFLGLVKGTASADIRAAVNDINIQRKSSYLKMASRKGESYENVTKTFAIELLERVPSGQMVRDVNGNWVRK